jgi:hypothetical protein
MKTPKEKSIELVDKFYNYVNCWGNDGNADYQLAMVNAKQCALIAVDEILNVIEVPSIEYKYWEEVKQEIKNK